MSKAGTRYQGRRTKACIGDESSPSRVRVPSGVQLQQLARRLHKTHPSTESGVMYNPNTGSSSNFGVGTPLPKPGESFVGRHRKARRNLTFTLGFRSRRSRQPLFPYRPRPSLATSISAQDLLSRTKSPMVMPSLRTTPCCAHRWLLVPASVRLGTSTVKATGCCVPVSGCFPTGLRPPTFRKSSAGILRA